MPQMSIRTLVLWQATLLCFLAASPSAAEPAFKSKALGAEFVLIPAGTYTMGTATSEKHYRREERHRTVIISKPFYLQTTEVTQKQWKKIMRSNPSRFKKCGANCPVENVSWLDVRTFIQRLNKKEKTASYRLPTEAEWEYAARAGGTSRFPWGDEPDCGQANYGNSPKRVLKECGETNPGKTNKAGSYPPNAWGLHDLAGNVYEWVSDIYTAYRPSLPGIDPLGPVGQKWEASAARVVRGGDWGSDASSIGVAARASVRQGEKFGREGSGTIGFRLVREVAEDSPDFQPVPPEGLKAFKVAHRDVFLLTETTPIDTLLLPQQVRSHELLATSVSGTIVDFHTGEPFEIAGSWTLPPEKFKVGDKFSIPYATNYVLEVEPFWQWGTFPVKRTDLGNGKQVAVIEVPDIPDWFGIRVRVRSSYLETGWIYHYERNLY